MENLPFDCNDRNSNTPRIQKMCWKTTIEERCKSCDDLLRTGFKLDKCAEYEEKGTCENGIRQLSQRVEDECKKYRELREEQERMAALNALPKTGK